MTFNLQKGSRVIALALSVLIAFRVFSQVADKPNVKSPDDILSAQERLNGNGIRFTPNKGQIADMAGNLRPDVLYKGEVFGAGIYLRKTGISYVYTNIDQVMHEVHEMVEELIKAGTITETDEHAVQNELMQREKLKIHRVDMDFEGCLPAGQAGDRNIETKNEGEIDGYENYYYAHCPQGITNVRQYNKVTCKNIYNGIDVVYYGHKTNGIKYDLVLKPHANPNQIKLHWKGAESIRINKEGHLVITTSVNEFTESIPKVYQNINGEIVDVKAKYVLTQISEGEQIVNFSFSIYNASFPLVIDPWATYYGGTDGGGGDYSAGLTTDKTGNVCITGDTWSVNFPVTAGAFQTVGGPVDGFVVKFNSAGFRQWGTFYGGSNWEYARDIATDKAGNVCITGNTWSADFPVTLLAFQSSLSGGSSTDAFVVKFNSTGARQWATFYGGSAMDIGFDIVTDNNDNVIITGSTQSPNFPVTATAFQVAYGGGGWDAFAVKYNPSGTPLWSTYLGGILRDEGLGVTSDISDNVLITGKTESSNFYVTAGAFQLLFKGGVTPYANDAFIIKFNPAGTPVWSTFCGGNLRDEGWDITTDNVANVIVTGLTTSVNFPVLTPSQMALNGSMNAFIIKFNSFGTCLWSTYFGANTVWSFGIVTDVNNYIYLYGEGEDIPTPSLIDACAYQTVLGGNEDQLIAKFSPAGQEICVTYMGGSQHDDLDTGGGGVAIYGNSIYITGTTNGGYPVTAGAFQTVYGGGQWDVFVASLCTNICEGKVLNINFVAGSTSICSNMPIKFTPTISNSCDTTGYKFHWEFTGGNPVSSDSVKPTVTFSGVGTHNVKLVIGTICKKDSITKPNYISITPCATCNLVGQFTKGTSNCSGCGCKQWILVNATGGTSPYTYSWPDGSVNRYKNQLCPGAYAVNIKDKNGCSINVNLTAP